MSSSSSKQNIIVIIYRPGQATSSFTSFSRLLKSVPTTKSEYNRSAFSTLFSILVNSMVITIYRLLFRVTIRKSVRPLHFKGISGTASNSKGKLQTPQTSRLLDLPFLKPRISRGLWAAIKLSSLATSLTTSLEIR